jgi:hypothetical protein
MPNVLFKFCALHYLNQWLAHDRIYCEGLAGKDEAAKLKSLKKAAAFYRVSRNLPEVYDSKKGLPRYKPVLDVLESVTPATFHGDDLIPAILRVRDQISTRYGERGVLSLTTKFLWLKVRSPIIIYDSKASSAVGVRTGDIREYYSKWRRRFNAHAKEIGVACSSLQAVIEYSVNPELATARYVEELSSHQWFQERVLDIYLWHLG